MRRAIPTQNGWFVGMALFMFSADMPWRALSGFMWLTGLVLVLTHFGSGQP